MNKRYMDFVPARSAAKPAMKKKPVMAERVDAEKKPAARAKVAKTTKSVEPRDVKRLVAKKDEPILGVVEDFGESDTVSGRETSAFSKNTAKEIKAKKVGLKAGKKETASATGLKTTKPEGTFKTPTPQFINQDRVIKRPLSKNTYQKKVSIPEEGEKGPVTIISKPEKQAHGGLIITIILTVILGAAAGTIAFLLLPK